MLKDIKEKCCGCGACADICPAHIISMQRDGLGFLYPHVDGEKCLNCNRCNSVCPNQKEKKRVWNVGEVECAYSRDDDIKEKCSSGGVFGEIARAFLKQGGVCFGAAFDESFSVRHICVECEDDLPKILGSKYIQSDTTGIFISVKKELKDNKPVLFAGTPCQVAALKSFLNKQDDNLFLVDLFCSNVPSPAVWQAWLQHVSNGRRVAAINFRDKTEGWNNYSLKIEFDTGELYRKNKREDGFLSTFSKGCYARPSCLSCVHKGFDKVSDLTLGDFQELGIMFPEIDGFRGVSMVRINSQKGKVLYETCKGKISYVTVKAEEMDKCHPNIGQPILGHPNREIFREKFAEGYPIEKLLKRYAGIPVRDKVKNILRNMTKKLGVYDLIKKVKA